MIGRVAVQASKLGKVRWEILILILLEILLEILKEKYNIRN